MFVHRDEIDLYWIFLHIPFNMIKNVLENNYMYSPLIECRLEQQNKV